MAVVARVGTASLCSPTPSRENTITGLKAGEAITAGDVCYIASDGTVKKSNGTANTAPAAAVGMAGGDSSLGEAVTLFVNCNFYYATGLTPGAPLYVFTTAGTLGDAATTGGLVPVARVIDATRIRFTGQA